MEYWSNKKFMDRIRGTKKPKFATARQWREWKEKASLEHPLRFWFVETALDVIQAVFRFPIEKMYDIKYYVTNRWIDQSHALVAHPKHIKPGRWQDLDYRILHCTFDELVDFVEIEKAYMNFRWDEERAKKLKWWQGGRWRTRTWRNAEAGLEHLRWEVEADDVPFGQSNAAREVMFLYDWWVNIRPSRPDPMVISGWSDYCDKHRQGGHVLGVLEDDKNVTGPMLSKMRKLEEQYDEEDTEMLIRLIKIRGYLWT